MTGQMSDAPMDDADSLVQSSPPRRLAPAIAAAAHRLKAKSFVIGDDLVCCRDDGVMDFEMLRSRRNDGAATPTALSPMNISREA